MPQSGKRKRKTKQMKKLTKVIWNQISFMKKYMKNYILKEKNII